MPKSSAEAAEIIQLLHDDAIEFVVVGGVCAVLHGAPITTFDLDIVFRQEPGNIDRLIQLLLKIGAYYRGRGKQRLSPTRKHLTTGGHFLFHTDLGPFDVLSSIGKGHRYENLLQRTVQIQIGSAIIRILDLPDLIEIKKESMREKDSLPLTIMQRVLIERNSAGQHQ